MATNESHDLKVVKRIGSGGFSVVFQAIWKGQQVAAKRLNDFDQHEIDILSGLDHPNIVKLLGVVHGQFELYLILELCKGGSLRSFLDEQKSNSKRLSKDQVYDWAKQAAYPIQYLRQNNIVHKDVKSPNNLIADGNILKLADFGLAKNIAGTITNATNRASHPWMAPELLKDFILSPNYDIFAYGVVVWELWTTDMPFEGAEPINITWRVCQNNERPPIPPDCPKPLADLMRQCWETDWHKRPSIDHILAVLTSDSAEKEDEDVAVADTEGQTQEERQLRLIAGPWVLEKEIGQHGSGELSTPKGIAVNPNGDVAVADRYTSEVKIYSSEGAYKFKLNTAEVLDPGAESKPWNVSVSSEGNYYVTDNTQHVKMFNAEGVYKDKWAAVSPENKPSDGALWGLTMDAKGHLLVGNVMHKYISRHRQDGSHITSVKVGIHPYNLAVTSKDTIIISSFNPLVAQIVDNEGQVLHTLKPPSDVTDWQPWGVCCYEDLIFICNLPLPRHGICCFSVSGEYLGSIAVTRDPRGITFVKGSNRFLLACGDRVLVYSSKR